MRQVVLCHADVDMIYWYVLRYPSALGTERRLILAEISKGGIATILHSTTAGNRTSRSGTRVWMFTNDLKMPNSFGIPITRAIGLSLSKSGWQSTGSSRWAGKGHSTRFTARRRIAERQKGIIFSKTISPPPPSPVCQARVEAVWAGSRIR